MYKIGWFSTGRDKAARDLLKAVNTSIKRGEIPAEITFVFSSREPGESGDSDLFLKLAESYHIPLVAFSYHKYQATQRLAASEHAGGLPGWRLDYDREVMKRLSNFKYDLCVLAGYMLIVGPEMCQHYNMINLHPAAPGGPSGTWQEVIWQLIDGDAEQTGVMMHLVTPELDKGPVVTYCTFPIRGKPFDRYWLETKGQSLGQIKQSQGESNPLFKLIRSYGLAREFPLIIATIKAFSQGKVRITGDKKIIDADRNFINGYNLSYEIDELVKDTLST